MTTYWVETDTVWCGCRTTTLEGFADAVESEYGSGKNPLHYAYYKGAVALFRAMRQEIMGQIPGDGEKRSE